jgi:hypothetical protein
MCATWRSFIVTRRWRSEVRGDSDWVGLKGCRRPQIFYAAALVIRATRISYAIIPRIFYAGANNTIFYADANNCCLTVATARAP